MWMCYAAESWPKAADLESAIRRIACQLSDFQYDAVLCQNKGYESEDEQYYKGKEEVYRRGLILCDKYFEGNINLEEFCDLLACIKLTEFLLDLKDFLPENLSLKYQAKHTESSSLHDTINCAGCSLGDELRDYVYFDIPLTKEKKEVEN